MNTHTHLPGVDYRLLVSRHKNSFHEESFSSVFEATVTSEYTAVTAAPRHRDMEPLRFRKIVMIIVFGERSGK